MTDFDTARLLVEPDWLERNLQTRGIRVLDCTTYMTPQPVGPSRIDSGRPDWVREHIPGSDHLCMVADLSDPAGAFPYTLPQENQVSELLSRLGIQHSDHLVLYGAAHPMVVTRAWWVLTAMGHARTSVLNGGWERWKREQRPTSAEWSARPASTYTARRQPGLVVDAESVARASTDGVWLVNALSPEQFTGRGGAHYGRPGRIPDSINVPARELVDPETMNWLSVDDLARKFASAGLPAAPDVPVITYCGGGIAASSTLFALRLLGRERVALYDNSLLEWSSDPTRPMVIGG